MAALAEPTTDLLREIVLDTRRDLPLHAQLRLSLERLIEEHFEDQSRFYSESQLIDNLKVSQGTVRRALADLAQRGILEKRRARCTIVCKQSTTAELRNLAVFLPDYTSQHVATWLGHLNAECLNRGIRMQPIYTHRGERLLKAYNNLNFSSHEGGVVLLENSPRATVELASALGDKGYECVIVGTVLKGFPGKFVGGNNASLVQRGLEHLAELGHRRVTLLINEPEEKESVQERITAFKDWTPPAGVDWVGRIAHSGSHLWDDAYVAAQKAMEKVDLAAADAPTAIFAISDVGALGALKWLQQHGHRVPEDFSVMGIGGIDLAAMVHPTITTLAVPLDELIANVFRLLIEKGGPRTLVSEPRLVPRESTAPPAR